MRTEADYLEQLQNLLAAPTHGMSWAARAAAARRLIDVAADGGPERAPTVRFVPFMPGRRPELEARHPGLGSSDHAAMLLGGASATNRAYLLYDVKNVAGRPDAGRFRLDVTLFLGDQNGEEAPAPLPGWVDREVKPCAFEETGDRVFVAEASSLEGRRVLVLEAERDLVPAAASVSGPWLTPNGPDSYAFARLFMENVRCELRLRRDDEVVSATTASLEVCDTSRMGSLYQRVVDRIVRPDTERQFREQGIEGADHAFHPWLPVLLIGADKAALYTRALVEDIVHKHGHLTDPRWLLRVGVYLEFLTCLGIFEAVKDSLGDVLTPGEREAFETSPAFAQLRERIDPRAWKRVWKLREMVFRKVGIPQTGPVSAANLLQKREAILAFLETHHHDLKHAIELAGPNPHNSQETWFRVFRDAERAVFRKTLEAFPEIGFLPKKAQAFVLWHRRGHFGGSEHSVLPGRLSGLFGDQDGLFACACTQYRASMNEVARWARNRGLMEYTGKECVPREVSLMEAYHDGRPDRIATLQRRDGYEEKLEIEEKLGIQREEDVREPRLSADKKFHLLRDAFIFRQLSDPECRWLAYVLRPIVLGPMERILIQGRPGSSLFLVAEGEFEVLVRQPNGKDLLVARVGAGASLGEMSFLTGAPRSATVRAAAAGGVVVEIGKDQYQPLVKARPELADDMAQLMAERAVTNRALAQAGNVDLKRDNLRLRIRKFFLGV